MFLHLSVSHSVHRGGYASVHAGIADPQGPDTPQDQTPTGPDTPHPGADTPHPGADTPWRSACWESGRYASYWNAYLLLLPFQIVFFWNINQSGQVYSPADKCIFMLLT